MTTNIPHDAPGSAEAARRTAAAAALADYWRAVDDEAQPNGPAVPWALWAGRLAAALESVLGVERPS